MAPVLPTMVAGRVEAWMYHRWQYAESGARGTQSGHRLRLRAGQRRAAAGISEAHLESGEAVGGEHLQLVERCGGLCRGLGIALR